LPFFYLQRALGVALLAVRKSNGMDGTCPGAVPFIAFSPLVAGCFSLGWLGRRQTRGRGRKHCCKSLQGRGRGGVRTGRGLGARRAHEPRGPQFAFWVQLGPFPQRQTQFVPQRARRLPGPPGPSPSNEPLTDPIARQRPRSHRRANQSRQGKRRLFLSIMPCGSVFLRKVAAKLSLVSGTQSPGAGRSRDSRSTGFEKSVRQNLMNEE
jgi:hypothetical protein